MSNTDLLLEEIITRLDHIEKKEEKIMADLTALDAAVSGLQSQLATDEATLTQVNQAVTDLVAAVGAGDQAGVDAATAALQAVTASLATDETSLQTDAAADPGPQA